MAFVISDVELGKIWAHIFQIIIQKECLMHRSEKLQISFP